MPIWYILVYFKPRSGILGSQKSGKAVPDGRKKGKKAEGRSEGRRSMARNHQTIKNIVKFLLWGSNNIRGKNIFPQLFLVSEINVIRLHFSDESLLFYSRVVPGVLSVARKRSLYLYFMQKYFRNHFISKFDYLLSASFMTNLLTFSERRLIWNKFGKL